MAVKFLKTCDRRKNHQNTNTRKSHVTPMFTTICSRHRSCKQAYVNQHAIPPCQPNSPNSSPGQLLNVVQSGIHHQNQPFKYFACDGSKYTRRQNQQDKSQIQDSTCGQDDEQIGKQEIQGELMEIIRCQRPCTRLSG